ncbi:MAG: thioesterase family protein [Streptococcaceae bacterium]|jgi:predicted thioesterase|nr:thioesterase family protein [Streptococcaceae bacterium]
MKSKIKVGESAFLTTTVTRDNVASAVKSGLLDVFATPCMIALMENAADACIAEHLEAGESSVGTRIEVTHQRASQIGSQITAVATVLSVTGNKIEFSLVARDALKREIGRGTHARAVIDVARFMARFQLESSLSH